MSDPAKSVGDIDDVLSSIRRLVSEQPSGQPRAARPPAHARGAGDKLVLTPALRVSDGDEAARDDAARDGDARDGNVPADASAVPNDEIAWQGASPDNEADAREAVASGPEAMDAFLAPDMSDPDTSAPDMSDPETSTPGQASADTDDLAQDVSTEASHEHDATAEADPPDHMDADEASSDHDMTVAAVTSAIGGDAGEPEAETPEAVIHDGAGAEDEHDASPDFAALVADAGPVDSDPAHTDPADVAAADPAAGEAREADAPEADEPRLEAALQEIAALSEAGAAADADAAGDVDEAVSAEATQAERPVGSDGWRPEMRLLDWDSLHADGEGANGAPISSSSEFEPDTGDADWPDAGADRALLDLAAVREAAGSLPGAPEDGGASGTGGAAPIFSLRSGDDVPPVKEDDEARDGDQPPADPQSAESPALPEAEAAADAPAAEDAEASIAQDASVTLDDADETEADGGPAREWRGDDEIEASGVAAAAGTADDADDLEEQGGNAFSPAYDPDEATDLPEPRAAGDEAEDGRDEVAEAARPTAAGDDPVSSAVSEGLQDAALRLAGIMSVVQAAEDAAAPDRAEADDGGDALGLDLAGEEEEDFLDEDTLRRIVAEVVREELQGALGERITRNVRKLVRREIRLILAADELD
ncbi:hypothetical protein P6F26_08725 [Roseibacterium sp. SDUM158017]|uniref:hypothetical protein n=1 Tax=Roseicyclus salinarum TaxID=3036773 RepID=UPI0024157B1F|nr:hypothetical protein [Roseibacterium sp. SDUM158017]MDG4648528.1 hypothetical protein [Roseibacterium sp. SDUM158017]